MGHHSLAHVFFWGKKQVFTSRKSFLEKVARTNGKTAYLNKKPKTLAKIRRGKYRGVLVGANGGVAGCTNGAKQPEMPPCMSASISEAVYRPSTSFATPFSPLFHLLTLRYFPTRLNLDCPLLQFAVRNVSYFFLFPP